MNLYALVIRVCYIGILVGIHRPDQRRWFHCIVLNWCPRALGNLGPDGIYIGNGQLYVAEKPHNIVRKSLHLLSLRTELQQHKVNSRRSKGAEAVGELCGCADQTGA